MNQAALALSGELAEQLRPQLVPTRCAAPLYEIADHLTALLDTADMCSDDQRGEIEAEIMEYVSAQVSKVDAIGRALTFFEDQQEAAAKEVKRLQTRKGVYARAEERLRQYLAYVMETRELAKLKGTTGTLSLRAGSESVEITDLEAVPPQFKITTIEVSADKTALKAALKGGEVVAGAKLATGNPFVQWR
jgi:hypothetical protein